MSGKGSKDVMRASSGGEVQISDGFHTIHFTKRTDGRKGGFCAGSLLVGRVALHVKLKMDSGQSTEQLRTLKCTNPVVVNHRPRLALLLRGIEVREVRSKSVV